jgi:TRAP transporter TAXI family solute receptor
VKRRQLLKAGAGLAATAVPWPGAAHAQDNRPKGDGMAQGQKTVLVLGTATPGGGFPLYGGAVAEIINSTDPSLAIETRNTKGSTENVPLLEANQIDIGLVQGEVAYEALTGIGRAPAPLKIVTAMYSTPGMFVVKGDSPAHRITDLLGKPVAFGARGSGLVILSRYVLDGLGLDQDKDFQAIYLDRAGDGPAMVLDGRAAALWGGGIGWPGFTAVMEKGGRFIAPDAEESQRIRAKHPFLKPLTIPAGSYPGEDRQVHSVGSWSFILAKPALGDDVAYRLARALHDAEPALAKRLPQAAETTAANTVAAAPRPNHIHPGVQRYLREIGLLT